MTTSKVLLKWSIDHGNRFIKGYDGRQEIVIDNGLAIRGNSIIKNDVIVYEGKKYQVEGRANYKMDKTVDDEVFISSLKAFGVFMQREQVFEAEVNLAIGVPISHGFLKNRYVKKFGNDGEWIEFSYSGIFYRVKIVEVFCFYQSLAAYSLQYSSYNNSYLKELHSYNLIDVGMRTVDVCRMVANRPDLNSSMSLSNGVLSLISEIREQLRRHNGVEMEESQIETILKQEDKAFIDEGINAIFEECISNYLQKLQSDLTVNGIEIEYSGNLLIGGGGAFVHDQLYKMAGNLNRMNYFFLIDNAVTANVRGYHYLMNQVLKRRVKYGNEKE